MPVLTLEKKTVSLPSLSPALSRIAALARQPFRIPAWTVMGALVLVGVSSFMAGRHKPTHHYVSYFGYPMVLDTTTGKACYAAPPRQSDSIIQPAAYSVDGAADTTNLPAGPSIPMCGNE